MSAPYTWQVQQWQRMNAARQQQRLHHALLLNGIRGLGLEAFAQELARGLLCEQPGEEGGACGQCKSCLLYAAGSHPDIVQIRPEEDSRVIKIDAIRELTGFMELKAQYGRYRIAIIDPAEAMNRNAANSLLKTLEEPPEQAIIILVNNDYMRLPVTIRSRCQRLIFTPPDRQ